MKETPLGTNPPPLFEDRPGPGLEPVGGGFKPSFAIAHPGGGAYFIFALNTHAPFRGTTMNENSNLYLMLLCQQCQLSQWPVFNRPTQRAQPVIFVLKALRSN
jgi:hypothetical protein